MLDDDINEFVVGWDDDFLGLGAVKVLLDFRLGESELLQLVVILEIVGSDLEFGAKFTVDLDNDLGSVGDEVFIVPFRPFVVGI